MEQRMCFPCDLHALDGHVARVLPRAHQSHGAYIRCFLFSIRFSDFTVLGLGYGIIPGGQGHLKFTKDLSRYLRWLALWAREGGSVEERMV